MKNKTPQQKAKLILILTALSPVILVPLAICFLITYGDILPLFALVLIYYLIFAIVVGTVILILAVYKFLTYLLK